jgi:hypothetical protein
MNDVVPHIGSTFRRLESRFVQSAWDERMLKQLIRNVVATLCLVEKTLIMMALCIGLEQG